MTLWIILMILAVFLSICYWGLPFISIKKKGYREPDEKTLSDYVKPALLKQKGKIGILLIHGFEASPFEMYELGRYLHACGYSVSIPLLPGHGTSIDHLIQTDFHDWYRHVEKNYLELKKNCEKVYVAGLSLGGLLTLKIAENHNPDGVITLSAPVLMNHLFNGKWVITDFRLFFSGLLALLVKKFRITRKSDQELCPWEGYMHHVALNCVHSIKRNIPSVRKRLYKITSPICMIHALNDHTIPIQNLYYIFQSVSSSEKRAYSFQIPNELTSNHVLTTHSMVKDKVFSLILGFIQDAEKKFQEKPQKVIGFKAYLKYSWSRLTRRFGFKTF